MNFHEQIFESQQLPAMYFAILKNEVLMVGFSEGFLGDTFGHIPGVEIIYRSTNASWEEWSEYRKGVDECEITETHVDFKEAPYWEKGN